MLKTMIALSLLLLPGLASAQVGNCFDCVLGVWDDEALTSNQGSITANEPKDVYVGIHVAGAVDDLTGIEFSIAGLTSDRLFLLGALPLGPRALVWGTVPAPADTSARSAGDGGATVAWSECQAGNRALMRLTLFATGPISDQVLQVKRSYPTTSPEWRTPILTRCDRPTYSVVRVTGGCYVLNRTGTKDLSCNDSFAPTAVEPVAWTTVRQFYR